MTYKNRILRTAGMVTIALATFSGCEKLTTKSSTATSQSSAGTIDIKNQELGSVYGEPVKFDTLTLQEKEKIYEGQKQAYDAITNTLQNKAMDKYLQEYQKKNKLSSAGEALQHYTDANFKVDEKEVEKMLVQYKDAPQLKEKKPEEQKKMVRDFLKRNLMGQAQGQIISTLQKEGKIKVSFTLPEAPRYEVSDKDHFFWGPENAPIKFIVFTEFECPYCSRFYPSVWSAIKKDEFKGKIKYVIKDLPLNFHPRAKPAAIAARCAGQLKGSETYFKMHDLIFDNQHRLKEEGLFAELAKKLDLDLKKFEECEKDPKIAFKVEKDLLEGQELGVQGTPGYFINGKKFGGAHSTEMIVDNLREEVELLKSQGKW